MPPVPSTWDMPANSDGFFPRNEGDRLANEAGYFVWSHRMRKALGYCGLLVVVDGTLPEPTDATQRAVWLKMDAAASVLIASCITGNLVIKITHAHTAKASWDLIAKEYSERSGPIIHWFRRLTKHMENGGDISAHIIAYQEAVRYLAHANFALPEWLAAAILLSTLPSDPNDPGSWDTFVNAARMDKATMTLSSVVSDILEEKRGHGSTPAVSSATSEISRAVGIKFCTDCEKEGHIQEECTVITEETRRKAREIDKEERVRSRSQTKAYRETLLAARSEEYTRRKMEEKEKRRQTYAVRKEAELAARKEEEERQIAEAEERRLEEESARKRQEEERLAEQRQERKTERAVIAEETRRKALREAEAEERARLRSQARSTSGWRARMHIPSPNVTNTPLHESTKDASSSGAVPETKVWRPKRLRNRP